MPLEILGCTRHTMTVSTSCYLERGGQSFKCCRSGDWRLKFFVMNEECLVGRRHHRLPTTSMFFVHTARHFYRLDIQLSYSDGMLSLLSVPEVSRGLISRGRTSRNKVAVGEPAAGSIYQEILLTSVTITFKLIFNHYCSESFSLSRH